MSTKLPTVQGSQTLYFPERLVKADRRTTVLNTAQAADFRVTASKIAITDMCLLVLVTQ